MSNDRYEDFREGMAQRYGDPCMSGNKKEPRNNMKDWSRWDNPSQPSKKKVVEPVLPRADLEQLEQDQLAAVAVKGKSPWDI